MSRTMTNMNGVKYDFDTEYDKSQRIAKEFNFLSVWSIYPTNFDECPFTDISTIEYNCHWGDGSVMDTVDRPKTWLQIWEACDKLIQMSGDNHHVFIEAVKPTDRPGVYELYTGS